MTRNAGAPEWLRRPDDDLEWESRPHPVAMGAGLPAALVLVVAGAAVALWGASETLSAATWGGTGVAALGVVVFAVQYVAWTRTSYAMTGSGVYVRRGLTAPTVEYVPFERVDAVEMSQAVDGELFGYGTVRVRSDDGETLTLARVPRPYQAKWRLDDRLESGMGTAPEPTE